MKKDKIQQFIKILAIIILGGMVLYSIFRMVYETEMLKGTTIEIPAVLKEIRDSSSKSSKKALVFYKVNNKGYEFYSDNDYMDMNVGDTVLIEYSEKDPGVARVKEKYYMEKYKHLKINTQEKVKNFKKED